MKVIQGELGIRRLAPGDAVALATFYNELSKQSRRTFRPLGWTASVEACAGVIRDQAVEKGSLGIGSRYDLVAWDGPQIVGWSFLWWNVGSDEPSFGLGIADAYQGRGLGSALMDRVLEAAQELGITRLSLTVVQDNLVARRMYERRGFRLAGEFVDEKDGLAYFAMKKSLGRGGLR